MFQLEGERGEAAWETLKYTNGALNSTCNDESLKVENWCRIQFFLAPFWWSAKIPTRAKSAEIALSGRRATQRWLCSFDLSRRSCEYWWREWICWSHKPREDGRNFNSLTKVDNRMTSKTEMAELLKRDQSYKEAKIYFHFFSSFESHSALFTPTCKPRLRHFLRIKLLIIKIKSIQFNKKQPVLVGGWEVERNPVEYFLGRDKALKGGKKEKKWSRAVSKSEKTSWKLFYFLLPDFLCSKWIFPPLPLPFRFPHPTAAFYICGVGVARMLVESFEGKRAHERKGSGEITNNICSLK